MNGSHSNGVTKNTMTTAIREESAPLPSPSASLGATPAIAVVGVSTIFPGSSDVAGFWRDVLRGRDNLTEVPRTHWLKGDYFDARPVTPDKVCSTRGGFLPSVEFAPLEFGMPPNVVQATDTSQLLALIVAKRVLEEATRGRFESMDRSRTSVVLGVASATELVAHMSGRLQIPIVERAMRNAGLEKEEVTRVADLLRASYTPWQENTFPGLLGNVVAGRIANRLDLGGTNSVVDAACASSLAAVDIGINELALGRSDLVITGGVDTLNDILMFMCFAQTGALSPTGDCRPFSDDADGTMLGEGIGMVALKRLADAERDGDAIYAVIRGVGTSSDGKAKSIYAPAAEGQALALTRAYERAGYGPETVELVEAHGTATKAGDAAEVQALKAVFGRAGAAESSCALGSVKAQIGHTKAAAGSAGLIKTVLALHHKVLPGTYKVRKPSPDLGIEGSAFYLNAETRPWVRGGDRPRRASVSALGFGGTNFHVAVEEYRGAAPRPLRIRTCASELVLFHGADAAAIATQCRSAASALVDTAAFVHLAKKSQHVFDSKAPARLAIVAASEVELREKLLEAAQSLDKSSAPFTSPRGIVFGTGAAAGPVAIMFPGQGSQYVGMGKDLAVHFDCVRATWDAAANVTGGAGPRLHDVVFPAAAWSDEAKQSLEARLTATEWAQPAIAAASLSMLAILERLGVTPMCAGGHSLGEVTALGAFGAIDRDATIAVARKRGELVAAAAKTGKGAMIAVVADLPKVRSLLATWKLELALANHNAPQQVVLSGSVEAIEQAEKRLAAEGIEARRLPVSAAFHSPLVASACAPFRTFLDGIKTGAPRVPLYSNRTGKALPQGASVRDEAARAVAEPVLFVDQIEAMYAAGARVFVEVGPSSVLTKLVGRCLEGRAHVAVEMDARGKDGVTALWNALARLSGAGVALAFDALWEGDALPVDPATKTKAKLALELTGANYGKPLPVDAPKANARTSAVKASATQVTNMTNATTNMTNATNATQPPTTTPVTPAPVATPAPMARVATPLAAPVAHYAAHAIPASVQGSLIALQMEYQRLMAESHTTFLRTIPTMYGHAPMHAPAPMHAAPMQMIAAPMQMQAAPMQMQAAPAAPMQMQAAPMPMPAAPIAAPAPAPVAAAAAAPAVDLVKLMLDVVAEKTGYPAEMIELTMDLESDLGIDSIKRVEILSAVRKRAPGLPAVDTARMARMRTLRESVDFFGDVPATPGAAAPAPVAPVASAPAANTNAPAVDLVKLMLEVVAEKTGYPAEMIELTMDLESDLGIDSIKRVEILSAVRKRAPGLPQVDTARMARMRTLREIVDFFGGGGGAPPPPNGPSGGTRPAASEHGAAPAGGPAAAAKANGSASTSARAFGRLATREIAAPALGLAVGGLFAGDVVVTPDWSEADGQTRPDGGGVAAALVARLRERGVAAREVAEVPESAKAVIFLGGLRNVASVDDAVVVNREAFLAARAVASRFRESGGAFVTVQDTGGDFGLDGRSGDRAWLAGLGALAKTAADEWPSATVRAIDVERGGRDDAAVAKAIASELLFGGPEREIGLRADGTRSEIVGVAAPALRPGSAIPRGAVFVASGGARGVTASALVALAREAQPKLLLLGRSPLVDEPEAFRACTDDAQLKRAALTEASRSGTPATPKDLSRRVNEIVSSREVRETLRQVEQAGGQVRYAAVDVRDRAALDVVLGDVRRTWGSIDGLVHGAGVLSDAFIDKKRDAQFDHVWNTKVGGLRALLDATRGDSLKWICLFSSVAARFGNAGQADYAMANEVLNKVAASEARKRGESCRVVSVGWGPWAGGMVTPTLAAHFESRGVKLLAVDAGAEAFVRELTGVGDIEIGISGDTDVSLPTGLVSPSASLRSGLVSPSASLRSGLVSPSASLRSGLLRSGPRRIDAEVIVNEQSWPQLASHRIQGKVVLPMAVALELFSRVAQSFCGKQDALHFRDLRVVRGVTLAAYATEAGDRLRLVAQPLESGASIAFELRDDRDVLRYAATLDLEPMPDRSEAEGETRTAASLASEMKLSSSPWKNTELYGPETLFHGPHFHVLERVEGISPDHARAAVTSTRHAGWTGEWHGEPAAFDGAIQLALLFALHGGLGHTLPMRVDRVVVRAGDILGTLRCDLTKRSLTQDSLSCDISLSNATGARVLDLHGLEIFMVPSGSTASPTLGS